MMNTVSDNNQSMN